jgi:hypothetical protein
MHKNPLISALVLGCIATASQLSAATVSHVSSPLLSNTTTNFTVSVYSGQASYSGLVSGAFGDGTAEAWQLVRNVDDGGGVSTNNNIEVYSEQGSWGGTPTYSNTSDVRDYELARGDVWDTNNPSTESADFGGTTWTITGAYNTSTTLDISSYASGTVYIMAGGYDTIFQTGITMRGSGQTDLVAGSGSIDPPTQRTLYLNTFTFDNSEGNYDSIEFTYTGNSSNRARYMGVIVDAAAVPEPSTTALLGLGGLALILRRRK